MKVVNQHEISNGRVSTLFRFRLPSFLDLRKSVDPEMWKIPEDCSTLEKRAPTSEIVSAMLHAAHLQQAMKRGFPWISRGLVTQKRGFPWFGK